jgi:hypothetical protein
MLMASVSLAASVAGLVTVGIPGLHTARTEHTPRGKKDLGINTRVKPAIRKTGQSGDAGSRRRERRKGTYLNRNPSEKRYSLPLHRMVQVI